ncbi:hypothetical protein JCM6882_002351 [Rhodosporidiobolus microsporus]
MVPQLPPPVLDHVLSLDVLSRRDLAQCCLVARSFVDPARRTLYHHLTIKLEPIAGSTQCRITRSSKARERTVAQNPRVASLVRRIAVVEDESLGDVEEQRVTASIALARMLVHCRQVRWMDVTHCEDDFTSLLLSARLPLTHLFLNEATSHEHLLPLLPSLQHLSFTLDDETAVPADPTPVFLPSVRLSSVHPEGGAPLNVVRAFIPVFCAPGNPILTRLSIPADALSFPELDLAAFPSLTSLGLHAQDHTNSEAVKHHLPLVLSQLTALKGLALTGSAWARPEYLDLRTSSLAEILPVALQVLVLGQGFSLAEVLYTLGEGAARTKLHSFKWSPPEEVLERSLKSVEVRGLAGVCKKMGVRFQDVITYNGLMDFA